MRFDVWVREVDKITCYNLMRIACIDASTDPIFTHFLNDKDEVVVLIKTERIIAILRDDAIYA